MKNKKIISVFILLLCITTNGYSQYKSKQDSSKHIADSLNAIWTKLRTEYIPYENLVYNNGKFSASTPLDTLKKLFKIKVEKCIGYEDGEHYEYDCYVIGEHGTKIGNNTSANVEVIRDTLITFDKYPKLRVGSPLSNMKEYFPIHYNHLLLKYKNWTSEKKEKNRKQFDTIICESSAGDYPEYTLLLTLIIDFDVVTMKITGFRFLNGSQ